MTLILIGLASVATAQPTYDDDVREALLDSCIGCHRGSRARNGLKLDSYRALMEGGSSGSPVVVGDPGASLLYQVIAHEREPFMPPDEDPLPDEVQSLIAEWIRTGAKENASSVVDVPDAPAPLVIEARPEGAVVLPDGSRMQPAWWAIDAPAVQAIATSPTSPLVAIAGHRQVVLRHTSDATLLGVYPFEEGTIHDLSFSAEGGILVAGGGRGGESGVVAAWDVESGERLFTIGSEPDVVLGGSMSRDLRTVVMGGPDRVVRAHDVESGSLRYEIDAHTDWVTAVRHSPDGVLLATADRLGAVHVWEADTGRPFHDLGAHKARVTAIAWRPDSMVLASASDDGMVRLHDMETGRKIREWTDHGGVMAMAFAPDGRLFTTGRDGRGRIRDGAGNSVHEFAHGELAISCAVTSDMEHWFLGDDLGGVVGYDLSSEGGRAFGAAPPTIAQREAREAQAEVERLEGALPALRASLETSREAFAGATKEVEGARAEVGRLETQLEQLKAHEASCLETWERAHEDADRARADVEGAKTRLDATTESHEAARLRATEAANAALQALDAPDDRFEGLVAIARLAAQEAASLALDASLDAKRLEQANTRATPLLATERSRRTLLDQARGANATMSATVESARERLRGAESRLEASRESLDSRTSDLEASERGLAEAKARLKIRRDAMDEEMASLRATGGRVGS